ncbi:EamA family transporter [Cyanobacterium sp. uoEpiScrs1]|uniref:EamA family transporter n=1 Tax=Cyanobacterium sp. uoEpiScrs1 TaxID=2976343 RepID=UPI002269C072|nr:EamA family transporter [Cyanobacterium sp. uoEpiScrs1]
MKIFILLTCLAFTQVFGDILLSRGMKDFGIFEFSNPLIIPHLITYILSNIWIILGIIVLIISLGLYLTAISDLDLSYVLPIHASSYVLNGIFAWLLLDEKISIMRWSSTLLIAFGVFLVGLSDSKTVQVSHNRNITPQNLPLFLFPFNAAISKSWLIVLGISLSDSAGDLLLALGMKKIGKIEELTFNSMLKLIIKIITNPMIISGIACQGIAFFCFISVLTWLDISFVRPATALTYLISMFGAKYILHEKIEERKLIGISLIGLGVLVHS